MLHQDIHHFWFENRSLLEWQTNTQTHVILCVCVCVCVWEDMRESECEEEVPISHLFFGRQLTVLGETEGKLWENSESSTYKTMSVIHSK